MINLKELSNFELVLETKKCVLKERQATMAVLERLREIAGRAIHLEMGYSSLHEFAVVELGYSDGAAYRRIHAMRLCDELPEAREAIADGKLSLTTAASLEGFLRKEDGNLSAEDKQKLFQAVQGKSKTECERIFYPEKTGKIIEFIADDETLEDLKRLRELLAIAPSDMTSLIKKVAKLARKAIDPIMKKPCRSSAKQGTSPEKSAKLLDTASPEKPSCERKAARTYIPAATKREVWVRDGSQCTYVDALTGRRCSSRYGLQLDHRVPVACGGGNDATNLRLLCFGHNSLAAQRVFGRDKMNRYRVRGVS